MRRGLLFWGLVGVLATAVYLSTYRHARPEASLTLEVGREQARAQARAFVESQGVSLEGYREAIGFFTDDQSKEYLEKEAPADANRLMAEEVIPWYWYVRFFVPLQEEEFTVALAPDGRLLYYFHFLPEDAPAPAASADTARAAAEAFVATHLRRDPAAFRLVDNSDEILPNRREHSFTWEKIGFDVAGATLRIDVTTAGGSVTYAEEYLYIPEAWERDQEKQYARREFLTSVASYGLNALQLASLILLYVYLRSRQLRFRPVLGLAGLMLLIPMLEGLNALPSAWFQYDTADTVLSHFAEQCLGIAQYMLDGPVMVLIVAAPAITLAKKIFPDHPPLNEVFTRRFWCSRSVFVACCAGVGLAAVHCAFYNVFYLVGRPYGVWAPQETPFLDALGMPMPWIEPLSVGFRAAVDEELVFRLFAIALLIRLTRSKAVALLVPALIWGFLHSTYPQEPFYIRGVELTLVGLLYGMVFLRYGALATCLSHFAYNSIGSATFLLQSGDAYTIWSGVVVSGLTLLPLVPGLRRLAQGLPLEEHRATEPTEPQVPHPVPEKTVVEPVPFAPLRRRRLLGLAILAGALFACVFLPPAPHFGDHVQITADRIQAEAAAEAWLRDRGVEPDPFKRIALFHTNLNGDEADYIWQQRGLGGLRRIFQRSFSDRPAWQVRFFSPLSVERYAVQVSTEGRVLWHNHWLPETAPGARLSLEEARRIAETHLSETWGVRLRRYSLVYSQSTELDARTDHFFTWEEARRSVGDATYRRSVAVVGDEAMGGAAYLELPEAWLRARDEMRLRDIVLAAGSLVWGSVVAMLLLLLAYRLVALHLLRFRFALVLALFKPVAVLVGHANALPRFWAGYDTATDPQLFLMRKAMSWFVAEPVGTYLGAVLAIAFCDAAYRHVFPARTSLPQWFGLEPGRPRSCRRAWGEALILACCLSLAAFGIEGVLRATDIEEDLSAWDVDVHDSAPEASFAGGDTSWSPFLGLIGGRIQVLDIGLGLIFAVSVVRRYLWSWKRLLCAYTPLAIATALSETGDWIDGVASACGALIFFLLATGAALVLVRTLFRDNLPAVIATVFLITWPRDIEKLLHGPASGHTDAAILAALFGTVFLVGLWLCSTGRSEPPPLKVPIPRPHSRDFEAGSAPPGPPALPG